MHYLYAFRFCLSTANLEIVMSSLKLQYVCQYTEQRSKLVMCNNTLAIINTKTFVIFTAKVSLTKFLAFIQSYYTIILKSF